MTDPARRISVQVVDDHFLFASSLASVIKEIDRYRLIGIAVTGPQGLAMVREEQPDIVLLDYHLPGYSADALLPRFLAVSPHTKVIVLTSDTSQAAMENAIRAGAIGFMTKDKAIDDVLDALGIVASGGSLLTPAQRQIAAASAAQPPLWDAALDAGPPPPPAPAMPARAAPAPLLPSGGPSLGPSAASPLAAAPGDESTSPRAAPASASAPTPQAIADAPPAPHGTAGAPTPAPVAPVAPATAPEPVELRLEGVGSFAQAVLIERFIDRLPQVEQAYIRALDGDLASIRVTLGAGASADTLASELVDGSRRLRLRQASPGLLELQLEAPLIDG